MLNSRVEHTPDGGLTNNIEIAYAMTSLSVSTLRSKLLLGLPGRKIDVFKEFRLNFDYLYNLSSKYKGLNNDIVSKTKIWLFSRIQHTDQYMFHGIQLYEIYTKELFKNEMLSYRKKQV